MSRFPSTGPGSRVRKWVGPISVTHTVSVPKIGFLLSKSVLAIQFIYFKICFINYNVVKPVTKQAQTKHCELGESRVLPQTL